MLDNGEQHFHHPNISNVYMPLDTKVDKKFLQMMIWKQTTRSFIPALILTLMHAHIEPHINTHSEQVSKLKIATAIIVYLIAMFSLNQH